MQFLDRYCTFPTEQIVGAQNFNFAPKFPQNGYSAPNFAFLDENSTRGRFSNNFTTAHNLGGLLPRCHWILPFSQSVQFDCLCASAVVTNANSKPRA